MTAPAHRLFLIAYFGCLVAVVGLVSAFNAVVDPFQFYRIPTLYRPVYFGGFQRYQNAGLARTQRYDTVVTGSSVAENFLPSYIDKSWGVRALKLAISGSTSYEQFLVVRQALRTGQVKNVIWGLDAGAFYGAATRVRDDQAPFPHYMYRWPAAANIEYLYSLDTTRLSLLVLRGYGDRDLDKLDAWFARFTYSEAAVLKAWGGDCTKFQQKYREGDSRPPERMLAQMRDTLRRNLVDLVREHPEVTFHLFFPPVSTLTYVPAKSEFLPVLLPFRRAVSDAVADFPNARIFDFEVVSEITDNLANYKDQLHFSMPVSEYVIDAIRDGRHRIERADMESHNRRLIDQANRFDLCKDGRTVLSGKKGS